MKKIKITKFLNLLKGYKPVYIMIIVFCVLAAIFGLIAPYFLGYATDSLYNSVKSSLPINYTYLIKVLLIVLSCYIINAICTYFKNFLSSRLGQEIGFNIRKQISIKLTKARVKDLDKMKKGDIISKITNDVERLTDNITQVIPELIYNLSLILGATIMMFVLDIKLALISIIIIPITSLILYIVVGKTQKYFELNQKTLGNVNSIIEETVTNNDIIKSFGKENYFGKKFEKVSDEHALYGFKSSFYSSLAVPLNKFLGNIGYIVVVSYGALRVITGTLRLGAIQSFIEYLKDFNKPINTLAQVTSNLQMALASADRVYEILEMKEESVGEIEKITFNKKIEFKNVTFGYKKDSPVLKNFNLIINKGEKIAIVGKTGAGKTTIVNLLLGFYENYTGEILIDGVNIKDIEKTALRKKISMVLQDTWLFKDTIKNNIVFNKNISNKQLEKILKKAKTYHMINGLPDGLNFKINEETNNISSGEKQLLTISRALIAEPEILILDEATSNVDTRLEYIINKSMKSLMKGRTSLVIAHRLSTIIESDKIIVIKKGKIIESGTHKELLSQNGYYSKLYNSGIDLND